MNIKPKWKKSPKTQINLNTDGDGNQKLFRKSEKKLYSIYKTFV